MPPELDGARLDAALEALFEGRSRAAWQKAVRRGEVRLDGSVVRRSNGRVRRGQRLTVGGADGGPARPAPPPEPEVLHADDALVVLDKPAGWLTHPADRADGPDLVRFVADRFGPLPLPDDRAGARAGVVHRLDRWTSGVIVLARTDAALTALRAQFRARSVDKRYLALVHGTPREPRFAVDLPLRASRRQADLQLAGAHPEARAARTEFELEEPLGAVSLMACRPVTGRRHQIRAHLAAVDLPVVGDPLYRAPAEARARLRERGLALPRGRHALHAAELTLDLPGGGRRTFRAPLPPDLAALLEHARGR